MSFSLPRPGRALKVLLLVIGVVGIFQTFLVTWIPGGERAFFAFACSTRALAEWKLWTLLTAGVLTYPGSFTHLIFSLMGLYFFGADLERRWRAWRFLTFLVWSTMAGFLLSAAVDVLAGSGGPSSFHPPFFVGPGAAITACTIAWVRENPDSQVFFFFFPVRAKVLFWITIGFCVLNVVYPLGIAEGVGGPFGGAIVGLLLGGTPSVLRTLYLHGKLSLMRRRATHLQSYPPDMRPSPRAKPTGAGTPLRVIQGGLEDELRRRSPPKDKRFLN